MKSERSLLPWLAVFSLIHLTLLVDWERQGQGGGWIPWVGFYFLSFLPHSTRVSNLPRNWKTKHVADVIFEINQIQTRESIQREEGSICEIQTLPMRWLDVSPFPSILEVWALGMEGECHEGGRENGNRFDGRRGFYFSIYGEIQATVVLVGPIPCPPQHQGEKLMM